MPHFEVITDHHQLKTIFKRKDLFEIDNEKMLKIKQDLQSKYIFTVDYRKGVNHGVPEALSKSRVNDPDNDCNDSLEFGRIAAITGEIGVRDLNT